MLPKLKQQAEEKHTSLSVHFVAFDVDARELRQALAAYSPGDQVTIGWTDRSGAAQSATITLGTSPAN